MMQLKRLSLFSVSLSAQHRHITPLVAVVVLEELRPSLALLTRISSLVPLTLEVVAIALPPHILYPLPINPTITLVIMHSLPLLLLSLTPLLSLSQLLLLKVSKVIEQRNESSQYLLTNPSIYTNYKYQLHK